MSARNGKERRQWYASLAALTAMLLVWLPADPGGVVSAAVRLRTFASPSQLIKRRYALGGWQISISRSSFSGDVFCRLRSRDSKIIYVADALGFRFGKHSDVMNAWVKIDGEKPYRWRDDLPELARLGVAIDGRNLDAPTDGIVWVPVARLAGASRVAVQLRPNKRPRNFGLRGFASLHDRARGLGCAPEARFVR